jgi:hypothetical protein
MKMALIKTATSVSNPLRCVIEPKPSRMVTAGDEDDDEVTYIVEDDSGKVPVLLELWAAEPE